MIGGEDMAKTTGNRDKNGKFVKGNNSNGGRKPIPPEIKEALTSLVPRAVERLKEIVETSKDEKVVVKAVETIFDRVYGKPLQAVDMKSENEHKVEVILQGQAKEWAK